MSEVESSLATRTNREWLAALRAAGLVVGEVRSYDEVVESPQVEAMETIIDVPRGDGTSFKTVRVPARYQSWSAPDVGAPPAIGEHTEAVLIELGYGPEDIHRFGATGVIRSERNSTQKGEFSDSL